MCPQGAGVGEAPQDQSSQDSWGCVSPSHVSAGALRAPEALGGTAGPAQQPLTLDLVEVAGLLLGQQGRVGILPGIHFVHKEGAEPAAFIVLGIEAAGQRSSGGHAGVGGALALPSAQMPCFPMLVTHISGNRAMESSGGSSV